MVTRSPLRRLIGFGLILGTVFGIWDLLATAIDPLREDNASALLTFYGPMFAAWGTVGFVRARRTGRIVDGLRTGAVVAFATFLSFDLFAIIRANVFLETLTARSDWQALTRNYPGAKVESLHAYVTKSYVLGAPFKVCVATMIGAVIGTVSGLSSLIRRPSSR